MKLNTAAFLKLNLSCKSYYHYRNNNKICLGISRKKVVVKDFICETKIRANKEYYLKKYFCIINYL